MKILPVKNYTNLYNQNPSETNVKRKFEPYKNNSANLSFKRSVLTKLFDKAESYLEYKKAQKYADELYNYIVHKNLQDKFLFRHADMNKLEGLQYGIEAFKGMTMKEVQYTSEFLHIIAVKRGCSHMCGHCYASAKPSNREMSFEDFTTITDGFKTIRERLHGLDIYGNNIPASKKSPTYSTTELFFDADCIDIALKDKTGKEHEFPELIDMLHGSLGRKSVFDTAGWDLHNQKLQQRAERYAEFYSKPENMEKLCQFNVSFNVFNASYIASRKALANGDYEKAKRLKNKFLDNMANVLFTFTPVAQHKDFNILMRAFHPSAKNSSNFNSKDMSILKDNLLAKLKELYKKDFEGEQKIIKSQADYNKYVKIYEQKLSSRVDNSLNNSGRMKSFVDEHNIKDKSLQNHDEITPDAIKRLYPSDRLSTLIHHRLIDTDGRVYYMDYARIFPTEIQLNISGKNISTPRFGTLVDDVLITKENINYEG